jgi:hypothetical protein
MKSRIKIPSGIKMTLDRDEFDLPGWIRGQLKNMVGMVGT